MHLKFLSALATATLILAVPIPAYAQISEIRAGISEFDQDIIDLHLAAKRGSENSLAVNAEIVFESPQALAWAFSPRPYIGGTLNLGGKTSYAGGGVLWRKGFGEKFYGDLSFGLVAHNGTTEIGGFSDFTAEELNNPALAQQRINEYLNRFDSEIQLGSRILFREQIALGYNISNDWAGEVFWEHLSNGKILSSTHNEGVDILGMRAARKF